MDVWYTTIVILITSASAILSACFLALMVYVAFERKRR